MRRLRSGPGPLLLRLGLGAAAVAFAVDRSEAWDAAGRAWPPFVLVAGLLLVGVVAHDDGPGIPDLDQALRDGFSTSGSLGLGLPGVRRLVDEFKIESARNRGTTVTVTKWKSDNLSD